MTTQIETLGNRHSELTRELTQVEVELTSLRNQLGVAAMENDGGAQLELQAELTSAEGRRVALVAGLEVLDKELEKAREASALRHQKALLCEYYGLVAERLRLREPVARLALELDEARKPLEDFDLRGGGTRLGHLYRVFIGDGVTFEHARGVRADGGNDAGEILEDAERFEALAAGLKQELEETK